ncbi:transglycosylase SLT domain-containing protein (plasmid) [Acinetobacter sp. SK-43]|uniref:lytic transglycosylase domain-containing protein n=1 Tax=Acinetobacter sp. SK-43 TaxID=2785295 RepID=UPI00188B3FBF|nr:lytic transglycosylase domain-containing protein [Acinetobacter sp. SK-43]MBF4454048.1 transglycosylase SLT domain-containing protein [Acinetobacter sp. SK-43]
MICKRIILPFVVLTTTTLTQAVYAEIQIVRKEVVPVVTPTIALAMVSNPETTTSIQPSNVPSASKVSYSSTANTTKLSPQTQNELLRSVSANDFNAPTFATSVSTQNAKTFNTNIPQYSTSIKLRNPPPYVGCFYTSSRKYGVPVDLLMAIAQTESSFRTDIKGVLGKGADHGLMQINDYWVPKLRKRFNITLTDIYDPCTNIEIASWILAHNFVQFGYSWRAVGAYNAVTEWKRVRYINKVANNLNKLHAGQL